MKSLGNVFIIAGLAWLVLTALQTEVNKPESPGPSPEHIKYCKMVWGDSKHFDDCMNGVTIVPHSGRVN